MQSARAAPGLARERRKQTHSGVIRNRRHEGPLDTCQHLILVTGFLVSDLFGVRFLFILFVDFMNWVSRIKWPQKKQWYRGFLKTLFLKTWFPLKKLFFGDGFSASNYRLAKESFFGDGLSASNYRLAKKQKNGDCFSASNYRLAKLSP